MSWIDLQRRETFKLLQQTTGTHFTYIAKADPADIEKDESNISALYVGLQRREKFQLLKQRTATHFTNICFHFSLKRWIRQKGVYHAKCCALAYKRLKILQQHTSTHFTLPWLHLFVFVVLVVWRMDEWNIGYLSYQKLLIQVALRYHVEDVITI